MSECPHDQFELHNNKFKCVYCGCSERAIVDGLRAQVAAVEALHPGPGGDCLSYTEIAMEYGKVLDQVAALEGDKSCLKRALDAAVDFIEKHPADPDISDEQTTAWLRYNKVMHDLMMAGFVYTPPPSTAPAQGQWQHCSPALLESGVSCEDTPRRPCGCVPDNGGHDHWIESAPAQEGDG